ncbi:MAG: hypothetical protein Q4F09_07690 [Erysipelotrichaceae bacterium]|nr:hypothetical protein [Erysipelotrichaceae bacterium]
MSACDDAADKADVCRELIREKNLSYINILPYEGMDELSIQNFPTSLFFDNEGKVLTYPVIGVPADISEYEKTIDGLLNGKETSTDPVPAADENKKDYRIISKDEAGVPVGGVKVRFCDDTTCMFAKTDAEGTAAFSAEPVKYTVHMLTVPEGYELNEEEIPVVEDAQEVHILLKKA